MPVESNDRGLCDSKVPQIQFIAESEDTPVVQQRRGTHSSYCAAGSLVRYMAVGAAMMELFGHFRAPPDTSS